MFLSRLSPLSKDDDLKPVTLEEIAEVTGVSLSDIEQSIYEQEIEEYEEVTIPYNYKPYPFQREAWDAFDSGKKKFLFLWHRRAGKDKTMWNMFITFVIKAWETPGMYFYCLPSGTQAKKVIWNGIDNDGFAFLDHIPKCFVKSKNATEMTITLNNGSTVQLVGSDNYDRLVGSNPKGICFSEYSISNPLGYDYMRPVLTRNKGWVMFPYTPRGKNHGYRLLQAALQYPDEWFVSIKTIDDTCDHDGNRLITDEDIDKERALGMSENMIQQEYYVSFDAAVLGSYYAELIQQATKDMRICRVPIVKDKDTYVAFDVGRDTTALWFVQLHNTEIRIIDYYANLGIEIEHYINYLKEWQSKHNTLVSLCILPHDAANKSVLSKTSVQDRLKESGFKTEIAPRPNVVSRMDGINIVRGMFPRFIFDSLRCESGLEALSYYRCEYDEENRVLGKEPVHDWASHPADSLRYFCIWFHNSQQRIQNKMPTQITFKNNTSRRR